MKDNITGLPNVEKSEMRALLDKIKRNSEEQIELIKLRAKFDRERYKAYIEVGFKHEEALELLKAEKIKAEIR